ncbi:hypothetical protein AB834_01790 [PVC group bacterium (ex Bugula neritina AB1)]|nr:hypothetical protein AB834_01790 [PVC group bacterium (ex Bugula neritina AB1)]
MRRKRFPRKGFTLLEMAVAMTVFSVGILSVFSLFPQGAMSMDTLWKKISMDMATFSLYRNIHDLVNQGRQGASLEQERDFSLENPFVQEGLFLLQPETDERVEYRLFDLSYKIEMKEDDGEKKLNLKVYEKNFDENSRNVTWSI